MKADFLETHSGDKVKITLSEKNISELRNGKMLQGFKVSVEMEDVL